MSACRPPEVAVLPRQLGPLTLGPLTLAVAAAIAVLSPASTFRAAEQAGCPAATATAPLPLPTKAESRPLPAPPAVAGTYADQLRPTPLGWPLRRHWCVWVEPPTSADGSAAARRQQDWTDAVNAGLSAWSELLSLSRVSRPEQAQVRIWRRRPPLRRLANGRSRASHGRAVLQLLLVERQQRWQAEPRVELLLDPGQAPRFMQATALHELGHAFGLWGHSDDPADAMAAVPGARAVLQLSPRDRATLQWLLRQDGWLQTPPEPTRNPAAAQSPPQGLTAD